MKYWYLLKTMMLRHLAYRARVTIWFVYDLIHFVVFPFIWLGVYGHRDLINGFSRADIVTYYLVIAFISTTATSHLARVIRLDIIRGDLSAHLVRPIPYLFSPVLRDFSFHILILPISLLSLKILSLVSPSLIVMPFSLGHALLFIVAVFGTYLMSTCFEILIGLSSFWLGETSALEQSRTMLETVLSGQIAPLVFFPLVVQQVSSFLPFRYLFYFPSQLYLGKISDSEIVNGFAIEFVWIVALFAGVFILWRRGLHTYEGSGI